MSTTLNIDLLKTEADDGQIASVNPLSSEVAFATVSLPDYGDIEFRYDKTIGVLRVSSDYENFEIPGFMTPSMLGTGDRGKRGPTGRNGKNGKDGRDGKVGERGCPGQPGAMGEEGEEGEDAEDGLEGQVGIYGCPGFRGPTGNDGPVGPTGPDGSRGPTGPGCIVGPTGPTGPKPLETVYISDVEPTDPLVHIWAQPIGSDEVVVEPEPVPGMQGVVDSVTTTLSPTSGSYYQGIAPFSLKSFTGGVGPFRFQWSGDYATQSEVIVFETGEVDRNMNLQCRVYIATNATKRITGNVKLVITDLGNNNVTLELSASYTFNGSNASSGGGGGGGGGCWAYGSLVNVGGRRVPIQNVFEGDKIRGTSIPTLPDSTLNNAFMDWSDSNLNNTDVDVEIVQSIHRDFSYYYVVNNELRGTMEEFLLVKRDGVWSFRRMYSLRVGDILLHEEGERKITSFERIDQKISTVSLNVEMDDTYYVNGYLVHNRDDNYVIIKR